MKLKEKFTPGEIFYRLAFISELPKTHRLGNRTDRWGKFLCMCGNYVKRRIYCVINGKTKSCGCLNIEISKKTFTKHGGVKTREYSIYHGIKKRCYNKKANEYKNYGGRGIKMCEEWLSSFSNFLLDMGKCPHPKYTIERINNNGDYSPKNCKWASMEDQCRNKRTNRLITYNNITLALVEWAERLNVSVGCLEQRLYIRKWTEEKTISTPVRKQRNSMTYNEYQELKKRMHKNKLLRLA